MLNDTIVALATAPIESAIGVIRLSGDKSFKILEKIFSNYKEFEGRNKILHGKILDKETNHQVDDVLVFCFKGPYSFTGEDVVEISCHGGLVIINQIITLCLKYGARMAERGEFSKKSFINGKLDLVQAESIHDLIMAKSNEAASVALEGLKGTTSNKIHELRQEIVDLISHIEVNIDYPEYEDIEQITNEKLKPLLESIQDKISEILKEAEIGKIIKEGIKIAIVGKPNVGKSSLLNAFLNEDKAIVTNIEGTTRDIVEGNILLNGLPIHFIDTAGIRNPTDEVEAIGIKKSEEYIDKADLILFVVDGSNSLQDYDKEILKLIENKKYIVVINKGDLGKKVELEGIEISALNKNIDNLKEEIIKKINVNVKNYQNKGLLTNSRQIGLMKKAQENFKNAYEACLNYTPIDLVEIDVREGFDAILDLLGEISKVDLDKEIFSKFCLGK